jgi:hypothetical protein
LESIWRLSLGFCRSSLNPGAPIDSGEFVLVREVVSDLSPIGLLQCLAESLGKVFGGSCYDKLCLLIYVPPQDPGERVINRCAFRFLVEEVLDLIVMRLQEGARQVNKAGRRAFLLYLARGTCDDCGGTPVLVVAARCHWSVRWHPSLIEVPRTTDAALRRLTSSTRRTMAPAS